MGPRVSLDGVENEKKQKYFLPLRGLETLIVQAIITLCTDFAIID
jgi:hypothetical protein